MDNRRSTMHITYTALGILIVGWYQNLGFISGNVITDLLFLFPILILSHFIDIIPSGVPKTKDTLKFMIYSSIVSTAMCLLFSNLMNINPITVFFSALFVGWFDYLLWIARFMRNLGGVFSSIYTTLNWINIIVLHPYIIKDNGNFLRRFRHEEYEEELGGKKYRAFSQEKIWIFKEVCITLLLLSVQSLWNTAGSVAILVVITIIVFFEEALKKMAGKHI